MSDAEDTTDKKPIVIRNTTDLQRLKLEKLMKNPDRAIIIPEKQKEKGMPAVPDFVRNVMGSSAGAGSGEFHVYRHLRRKEYARQKYMKEKGERERLEQEYHNKLEQNKRKAEEKTAKKRAKRLRRKQKLKNKKIKVNNETSSESSESDISDDEEEEEDKKEINNENKDSLEPSSEKNNQSEIKEDQNNAIEECAKKVEDDHEGACEKLIQLKEIGNCVKQRCFVEKEENLIEGSANINDKL